MPQTKKQAVTSVNNNKTIAGWVIGLVVGLISLIFVYGIINVSFRSVIKSGCMDGGEVNEIACDCLAGVVSGKISVFGKTQLLLFGGSPLEYMDGIPLVEIIGCGLIGFDF